MKDDLKAMLVAFIVAAIFTVIFLYAIGVINP